jgi:hypothetical protein
LATKLKKREPEPTETKNLEKKKASEGQEAPEVLEKKKKLLVLKKKLALAKLNEGKK